MKIELIKTKETDGEWYKVYVDGLIKDIFGFKHIPEEDAKKKAMAVFNFYVEFAKNGFAKEIIESIEI